MVQPPRSKSRKVNGYVRDTLAYHALKARWEAKLAELEPLKQKMEDKANEAATRRATLTGGQMAEAERIINMVLVARNSGT